MGLLFGLTQLLLVQPERDDARAADRVAEDSLRLYGLAAEAREVCLRPLPDLNDLAVGHAPDRPDVMVAAMSADDGHVAIGL